MSQFVYVRYVHPFLSVHARASADAGAPCSCRSLLCAAGHNSDSPETAYASCPPPRCGPRHLLSHACNHRHTYLQRIRYIESQLTRLHRVRWEPVCCYSGSARAGPSISVKDCADLGPSLSYHAPSSIRSHPPQASTSSRRCTPASHTISHPPTRSRPCSRPLSLRSPLS